MLLDEILFMEIRVFRDFLNRFKMRAADAYRLFDENGIWNYIENGYDVLHMSGDECVLNDIKQILIKNGAMI